MTPVPDASDPIIWINGQPQPADGARVSARDRGFTLADGLFETMLVRAGTVFRLDRHVSRLERGLVALEIPVVPSLAEWVLRAVEAVGAADASVRLTVTRGVGDGISPPRDVRPTVVVAVGPMPVFPPEIYEEGVTAHIASGRLNERAMTAGLKTIAYTDAIAALIEAHGAGADEAVFLDIEGHCAEATASNLFIATRHVLLTPPVSCGVLPGITRAAVLELAQKLDVSARERPFGLDELLAADEAFLTSSLRGLAPLVRVDDHVIGAGKPGTLTRRLAASYADLIEEECRAGPGARDR